MAFHQPVRVGRHLESFGTSIIRSSRGPRTQHGRRGLPPCLCQRHGESLTPTVWIRADDVSRIKCIRAARNIIQSVRTEDSANPTPALYAAAMALFILSPPSPVTAYANWIVGICQADYESDVGVIERDVLPALPPAERTNMGLITQVIRDVDDTVPTLKEGLDLKWKPGHVFRHRLFSYVAVIRAWDMTCEASENCKFPSGSEMESSPRVNSSGFG